jgi:hypothetical protein
MAFDFSYAVTAPFRMQPGLRKLAAGDAQLTPNRTGARHLREKLAVLGQWPEHALLTVPGFDADPALQAAWRQAVAEHPTAFYIDPVSTHHEARWLGWRVNRAGEVQEVQPAEGHSAGPEVGTCLKRLPAAWRLAGLLCLALEEDLAIVDGHQATLPWLAVALPSHWDPRQKIGRHFAEVHAPVADNQVLVAAGAHLMKLVTSPQRWERFVWNVSPEPRLHQHPDRINPSGWHTLDAAAPLAAQAEALVSQAWFRTERQTFIPLPDLAQAVFTIQVDCQPLRSTITTPQQARQLHDALASMSPAVLAYRGLGAVQPALLRWLADQAARA